jgi:hypothetical protein
MQTSTTFGAALLAATLAASPAAAQPAPPPAPAPPMSTAPAATGDPQWSRPRDQTTDARFKVRVMEGVLERAVEHAATVMNQQLRAVSPDLMLLTGAARARGYRLDGYGLFFDVQVPAALRQSMGWTVRMMRQNTEGVDQALGVFKRMVGGLEGKARADAELALKQIELQVRPGFASETAPGSSVPPLFAVTSASSTSSSGAPSTGSAVGVSAASTTVGPAVESATPGSPATPPAEPASAAPAEALPAPAAPAESPRQAPAINPLLVQNPDLAYELEVREALIGAMVEWGATLPLEPTEWFTVAARDNEDVVIPGEASDVVTIIMRVRGSDLAEFRAGRLTGADIRKRVEVREF